jgi:hypothetical protein
MPSWYNSVLPPLVTLSKRNNRISPSDSPTFSHLLKRLTPNPIPESIIQQHIYMKSPYIVASGELAGSIVIEQGDTSIMQSLELSLIGVEGIPN